MDDAPPSSAVMTCAVCGERIRPGRTPGTYTHVARLLAACDMDGDHRPTPAMPPSAVPNATEPPPA